MNTKKSEIHTVRNKHSDAVGGTALDGLLDGYGKTMTVPEVAGALRMSKQGVYNWLHDGTITGYKIGATWFILREELKAQFVAGMNRNGPREEGEADGQG